ncbi:hypothetical protein C8R43DRAFT_1121664 [Mycena crocata]|nr:hypothetical protein C8R43DRAFT_1121664 [Mycena crocata]
MDPFVNARRHCQQLIAAEQRGNSMTFHLGGRCSGCFTTTNDDLGALKRCSGCSSTLYCSKKCQTLDWKGKAMDRESHKSRCSQFKAHLSLLGSVQSVIQSFPWGRVEQDGTFYHDCACARFNVLGGAGFGFWSQSGTVTSLANLEPPASQHGSGSIRLEPLEPVYHKDIL